MRPIYERRPTTSGAEGMASYRPSYATARIMKSTTTQTSEAQPPVGGSHERVVMSPSLKERTDMAEWKEFCDYFTRREGFTPTAGDSRVEELFNYYLVGAYDQSTGRHNKGYYAIQCNEAEERGGESIILSALEKAVDAKERELINLRFCYDELQRQLRSESERADKAEAEMLQWKSYAGTQAAIVKQLEGDQR